MKMLLLLFVVVCEAASARAATLSGEVSCEGCGPVAVRLVLGPSPLGPTLYTVTLDAAGPWSITLGDGTGLVGAYAFEDGDGDGDPDPGAVVTAYAANPIDVGSEDIAGVDLTVTPAEPPVVTLSGTVTCPGCDVVRVRLSPHATPLVPLLDVQLAGPLGAGGVPWSVEVPRALGALWVFGAASSGDDAWVAFAGNPLTIGEADVTGVDLALVAPQTAVVMSGTITCPSCEGGVGLEVRSDGALGPIVIGEALAAPGAFALSLPIDFGPVALVAFRDDDGDGAADPGAALGPYAQNPVTVARADIGGVALVVPEAGGEALHLSGTVACADCVGAGVALRLGGALGPEIMATALATGSGSWSLRVPAGLGLVGLLAFRDDDQDGLPDDGQPVGDYAQNPVDVGGADVTGLALSVPAKVVTAVTVSGTVVCSDCAAGVGARVHLGDAEGPLFTLVVLGAPGPFSIDLPLDLGDVGLVAFRDDDLDGLPDVGATEAEYAENPLTIGSSDVSDVTLTLPAGGAATVTVAGRIDCDDCAAGVGLVAVDDDGATLTRIHLAEPGSFTFALRRDAGPIALSAYRDDDGDLLPDEGPAPVAYAENPVVIGSESVSGIVIDLSPGGTADPGPEEPPDSASEQVEADDDASDEFDADEVVDALEDIAPEPDVDAPEPDVDAPEPDVDAPEPDVDAPEPDVDAPEPDVVAEADPTSDPSDSGSDVADRQDADQGGCGCSGGGGDEAVTWAVLALLARAGRRLRARSRPADTVA